MSWRCCDRQRKSWLNIILKQFSTYFLSYLSTVCKNIASVRHYLVIKDVFTISRLLYAICSCIRQLLPVLSLSLSIFMLTDTQPFWSCYMLSSWELLSIKKLMRNWFILVKELSYTQIIRDGQITNVTIFLLILAVMINFAIYVIILFSFVISSIVIEPYTSKW